MQMLQETRIGKNLPTYTASTRDSLTKAATDRPQVKHYRSRSSWDKTFYVGKGSILANPFRMEGGETGRAASIKKYRSWLWAQIKNRNPKVVAALDAITPDTVLVCHCHPKDCHADVVSKAWKWLQSARQKGQF